MTQIPSLQETEMSISMNLMHGWDLDMWVYGGIAEGWCLGSLVEDNCEEGRVGDQAFRFPLGQRGTSPTPRKPP